MTSPSPMLEWRCWAAVRSPALQHSARTRAPWHVIADAAIDETGRTRCGLEIVPGQGTFQTRFSTEGMCDACKRAVGVKKR